MGRIKVALLAILFFGAQVISGSSGPATVPAFLWSRHHLGSSPYGAKEVVNYGILSPKELANSVLSEGGWSKLVCPGENLQQNVDVAFVFVGRKLQSSDISKNSRVDPALVDLLQLSFSGSNFSMAFPYVATSDRKETLENSIISGFSENCGHGFGGSHIVLSEACSVDGEGFTKLPNLQSLQEYLSTKVEMGMKGQTDLVVFCNGESEESDHAQSEGKIFSELMNFLEKLGARYTALYASDPSKSLQYHPSRLLDRFLAEDVHGNSSSNSTHCDGVCQIKSSLLEGVFVGIVLLIILLSGLCCMMGIDTPTRFETPQEP